MECQCEIPEEGELIWCDRHGVWKCRDWVQNLCRTKENYFRGWEEGRGPGQDVPALTIPPKTRKRKPCGKKSADKEQFSEYVQPRDEDEQTFALSLCEDCNYCNDGRCKAPGCRELSPVCSQRVAQPRGRCPRGAW